MDNYHDLEQFLEEEQELAELGEMGNNIVQLPPIIMDNFYPFMCSDYDNTYPMISAKVTT